MWQAWCMRVGGPLCALSYGKLTSSRAQCLFLVFFLNKKNVRPKGSFINCVTRDRPFFRPRFTPPPSSRSRHAQDFSRFWPPSVTVFRHADPLPYKGQKNHFCRSNTHHTRLICHSPLSFTSYVAILIGYWQQHRSWRHTTHRTRAPCHSNRPFAWYTLQSSVMSILSDSSASSSAMSSPPATQRSRTTVGSPPGSITSSRGARSEIRKQLRQNDNINDNFYVFYLWNR